MTWGSMVARDTGCGPKLVLLGALQAWLVPRELDTCQFDRGNKRWSTAGRLRVGGSGAWLQVTQDVGHNLCHKGPWLVPPSQQGGEAKQACSAEMGGFGGSGMK